MLANQIHRYKQNALEGLISEIQKNKKQNTEYKVMNLFLHKATLNLLFWLNLKKNKNEVAIHIHTPHKNTQIVTV